MPRYINKLQDKKVLVLGGTSGIGFCVAEGALEHGAVVIVSSSRQSSIDAAIQRLQEAVPNSKVSGVICDLSGTDNLEENIKSLLESATKGGKLDHIVKTSGDPHKIPSLPEVTVEKWHTVQHVRFTASLILAKLSMAYMNVSNQSSFTMTGGVNTTRPTPGWAMAAGIGGATEALTRGLAVDMKPIRVNMVAPGAVMTELWQRSFKTEEAIQKIKDSYVTRHLTGEMGSPEDVAEAYLYLMKDKFVDGQLIYSEGGYLLM